LVFFPRRFRIARWLIAARVIADLLVFLSRFIFVGFVSPGRFRALEQRALHKGFLYVAAGPLVRSSYKAGEYYLEGMLRRRPDNVEGS